MLETSYEYLRSAPPFKRWKLPVTDEVEFVVSTSKSCGGWYNIKEDGTHLIAISQNSVGTSTDLIEIMAHEMIHLYEEHNGLAKGSSEHGVSFKKRAKLVCRHHGFNYEAFCK